MCEGVLARSNLAHNIRDCLPQARFAVVGKSALLATPALAPGASVTKFTRICTVENFALQIPSGNVTIFLWIETIGKHIMNL